MSSQSRLNLSLQMAWNALIAERCEFRQLICHIDGQTDSGRCGWRRCCQLPGKHRLEAVGVAVGKFELDRVAAGVYEDFCPDHAILRRLHRRHAAQQTFRWWAQGSVRWHSVMAGWLVAVG